MMEDFKAEHCLNHFPLQSDLMKRGFGSDIFMLGIVELIDVGHISNSKIQFAV